MDEYLVVNIKLKNISPFYTGEIKKERAPDVNLPVRKTGDGKAAVSIYGVLRSYLEKTLKEKGETVCDTGAKGARGCGRCVLCDLFGYLGKRGRAYIDDLFSLEPVRNISHPVTHNRINRETGSVSDALTMEEIKEGSEFEGRIRIVEPKERDIELISAGFEAMKEFGIGGWVTRGRGRVDITFTTEKRKWSHFLKRAKEIVQKLEK